ncbi:MAG: hypothetical protein NZL83_01765 [Candidatus Absconditabacterales bacterium]|nr:hypothetical protein [Candidatus Absconditabacterales bacterium]
MFVLGAIITILLTSMYGSVSAQDRPLVDFLLTLRAQHTDQTESGTEAQSNQTGSQSRQTTSSGTQMQASTSSLTQGDCDTNFGDIATNPFRQSILYVASHCLMFHTIREGSFFPTNYIRRHDIRQTIQRLLARQIITIHNTTAIEKLLTRRTIKDDDRRRLLRVERILGSGRLENKDDLVTRREARRLVGLLTIIIPGFDSSGLLILDSSANPYISRGERAFILSRLYRSGPHTLIINLEQPKTNLDHLFRIHASATPSQSSPSKPTKQTPEQVMITSAQSLGLTTVSSSTLDKPITPRDFLALLVLANHQANPHIPAYSDDPRYRNNQTMALLDQAKNLGLTRVWSGSTIDAIYHSSGFVSPSMVSELVAGEQNNDAGVITYRQALMTILPTYNIVPSHQLITRRTPAQRLKEILR